MGKWICVIRGILFEIVLKLGVIARFGARGVLFSEQLEEVGLGMRLTLYIFILFFCSVFICDCQKRMIKFNL